MNRVLIIGAGLSSHYLIEYLAKVVQNFKGRLTVADVSLAHAQEKIKNYAHIKALELDIMKQNEAESAINEVDIVISLLPAMLQSIVAKICLKLEKHLLTASYLPDEIRQMHEEATSKNLIFLNEMGLDPGIDHLSAMQIIHRIKNQGGIITSFKSFAGALIAPESDNNPWGYKFTWNPRNVVLAGQGTPVKFLENEQFKYIPYQQIFHQIQAIEVENFGAFEGYANRDSLSYLKIYGIENTKTILRGTLRKKGFCEAWAILVALGLTENGFALENSKELTYKEFVEGFLFENSKKPLKERIALQLKIPENSEALQKIEWLGLFDKEKINLDKASPAQILQNLLEKKWKLEVQDKDMIVMQHQIDYELDKKQNTLISEMAVIGEDSQHTAIAKTVGLPLAIATKLILEDKIKARGVLLPTTAEFYEPVLKELEEFGIVFREKHFEV